MRYSILDPTGNITALVESPVPVELQPSVASELMARHPEVEQVGFVRFGPEPALPEMRMAGGEFCGNATMSAAALHALRAGLVDESGKSISLLINVSGAVEPVAAELCQRANDAFDARVRIPEAREVCEVELSFADLAGTLTLVRMEGISHLIIERDSAFFALREVPVAAERAACAWCEGLGCDGLGLMFLEPTGVGWRMTPLVYVPVSGTVFWEHSCASGSAATGMYRAARESSPVSLAFTEPGGVLRVESDPSSGETWLSGGVRLVASYS